MNWKLDRYHRDLVASQMGVVCFHSVLGSLRTDNKAATNPPVSALVVVKLLCGRGEREEGTRFIVIATALCGDWAWVLIYCTAQEECRVFNFLLFLPASFSCDVLGGVAAVFTIITLLLFLENNIDDSGMNNNCIWCYELLRLTWQ